MAVLMRLELLAVCESHTSPKSVCPVQVPLLNFESTKSGLEIMGCRQVSGESEKIGGFCRCSLDGHNTLGAYFQGNLHLNWGCKSSHG